MMELKCVYGLQSKRCGARNELNFFFALSGGEVDAALFRKQTGQRRLNGMAAQLFALAAQSRRRSLFQLRPRPFRRHNNLAALSSLRRRNLNSPAARQAF